jgi:hypothetical protein
MRTCFVVCCVLMLLGAAAFGADGPVAKGSMILTGNVYFMSQSGDLYENSDGDGLTTVTLTPGFGYFISPGFVIGGDINYARVSMGDNYESVFSIGPKIGYYFGANNGRTEFKGAVYPFVTAFAAFGTMSASYTDEDISTTVFGLSGGVVYMVSNSVGLDMGLRFSSDKWSADYEGESHSESGASLLIGAGVSAFVF